MPPCGGASLVADRDSEGMVRCSRLCHDRASLHHVGSSSRRREPRNATGPTSPVSRGVPARPVERAAMRVEPPRCTRNLVIGDHIGHRLAEHILPLAPAALERLDDGRIRLAAWDRDARVLHSARFADIREGQAAAAHLAASDAGQPPMLGDLRTSCAI